MSRELALDACTLSVSVAFKFIGLSITAPMLAVQATDKQCDNLNYHH